MKTPPVVAELFHADGRMDQLTEITKLRVAFRNFTHASKNLLGSFHKFLSSFWTFSYHLFL